MSRRHVASGKGGPAWGTRLDLAMTMAAWPEAAPPVAAELDEPIQYAPVRLWTDAELSSAHRDLDLILASVRRSS